jgi:hypothetical protein
VFGITFLPNAHGWTVRCMRGIGEGELVTGLTSAAMASTRRRIGRSFRVKVRGMSSGLSLSISPRRTRFGALVGRAARHLRCGGSQSRGDARASGKSVEMGLVEISGHEFVHADDHAASRFRCNTRNAIGKPSQATVHQVHAPEIELTRRCAGRTLAPSRPREAGSVWRS